MKMNMAMAATATAIAAINPQSHRFPQDGGMGLFALRFDLPLLLLLLHRLPHRRTSHWDHLPVIEFGNVPLKRSLVVGIGELDPLLRTDQQHLPLEGVERKSGDLNTLSRRPAA